MVALQHDATLRAFYRQLVDRGKPKIVALCALMHKLVRQMTGRLKTYYAEREVGSFAG